jgi:hypothetical protein
MWFVPKSMRLWFAFMGVILWTGIYLTGFSTIHWIFYVPATAFVFSAITGICPTLTAAFKLFGVRIKEISNQSAS